MSYELSGEIIKVLDEIAKRFGLAIDWAGENVIPYVTELFNKFVSYKIAVNIVGIILFIIVLSANIIFWKKYYNSFALAKQSGESNFFIKVNTYKMYGSETSDYYHKEIPILITVILAAILLVSLVAFICEASNILKLICLPELYVMEYISRYIT